MDEGEGLNVVAPEPHAVNEFIEAQIEYVANHPELSTKRKSSVIRRFKDAQVAMSSDNAHPVHISGPMFYALQRFQGRAVQARQDFNNYLDQTARELGMTRNEAEVLFTEYQQEAIQGGTTKTADAAWVRNFQAQSMGDSELPADRTSLYAYAELEKRRATLKVLQPIMRSVTLEQVVDSSIAKIGYNPDFGYMEIEFKTRPGRQYSYQISQKEYETFRESPNLEAHYQTQIRGNPNFMFTSQEEWEAAKYRRKCATCGRFYAASCTCPVRGSDEEKTRTIRLARAGIMGSTEELEGEVHIMPVPARWRRYDNTEGGSENTVKSVSISDLKNQAKIIPESSTAQRLIFAPLTGTSVETTGEFHQTGGIHVEYLGHGRGYFVAAVTGPQDKIDRQLKCDCSEYTSAYTCKHVRALVADMSNRLNLPNVKRPEVDIRDARIGGQDLVLESYAGQVAWGEPESRWEDDSNLFSQVYLDAQTRFKNGLPAGEYRYENVTGGMGDELNGRAAGIELEFDLPEGMSEEQKQKAIHAIGKALYTQGLIKSTVLMEKDEAIAGGYSDTHKGGWLFVRDDTCAGEIVSPLMKDTRETWTVVETVLNIVKKYGASASVNTGFHVHVSTADYETSIPIDRLINNYNSNEDIIMRLAANPKTGKHRGIGHCARNITPSLGTKPVAEARLYQIEDPVSGDQRNAAINMLGIRGETSDHIEYRAFDGTLDAFTIQNQILLSLALTQDAMRDTQTLESLNSGLKGTHASERDDKYLSNESSKQVRAFLDRLFWRDQDKESITAAFAVGKWQKED
jgi:hypothetical protein